MQIYRRFCNAWPLILLAVFITATAVNLRTHLHAQPVIQSRSGMKDADARRLNAKLEQVDQRLTSPCADRVAQDMNDQAPVNDGASYVYSPHLRLHEPLISSANWGPQINYDFEVIDAVMDKCLQKRRH